MTPDANGQPRQRGLGKGLAALLGETMEPGTSGAREGALLSIPVEHLAPHPGQPRQRFDETEIESLAASIRARGIVQPLVVRLVEGEGGGGGGAARPTRSSPASGAGGRRSGPASTRCRRWCATSAMPRASRSPSSRTCSAAT